MKQIEIVNSGIGWITIWLFLIVVVLYNIGDSFEKIAIELDEANKLYMAANKLEYKNE